MSNFLMPRKNNIKKFIVPSELKPLSSISISDLPKEIINYIGDIVKITYPSQGMCSLVAILETKDKHYILKISHGAYRNSELYAEYVTMKLLRETSIPVPEVYLYITQGEYSFLLREFSEGKQLSTLFNDNKNDTERKHMINEMAMFLKKIHSTKIPKYSYVEFITSQLCFGEQHLKNQTIDESEFIFDGMRVDPLDMLRWLKLNIPSSTDVCLIHGDFRPKNFLWKDNKISYILDWAFCDLGDPYYDFAIFIYYLKSREERDYFFKCYGIERVDIKRLEYFERMVPFINI